MFVNVYVHVSFFLFSFFPPSLSISMCCVWWLPTEDKGILCWPSTYRPCLPPEWANHLEVKCRIANGPTAVVVLFFFVILLLVVLVRSTTTAGALFLFSRSCIHWMRRIWNPSILVCLFSPVFFSTHTRSIHTHTRSFFVRFGRALNNLIQL